MKPTLPPATRVALIFGAALLSTPALAQAGQTVTPPPVVPTVPQTQQVTPPAAVRIMPSAPIVQTVPVTPEVEAPAAAEPAARRAAAPVRAQRRAARPEPVRVAAPAESAPATAPVADTPVPAPETIAAETTLAPAPEAAVPVTETAAAPAEPAPATGGAIWPWVLGGLLLAGVAIALLMRRRRSEYDDYAEDYVEEPVTAEPAYVEPVAVMPAPIPRHEPEVTPRVAAEADVEVATALGEDVTVVAADAEDLAGVTAGAAPVAHRPWLELGMRPIRAGTQAEEGLVEIELIVANAGDMPAEDVRITTFMLQHGQSASETEAMLIERAGDTAVDPVTIAAGEGKCVDATLAVLKADLLDRGDRFSPVVVADARYRLADGSEGRTTASFRIGLIDDEHEGLEPIVLGRSQMHENVGAELEGAPARV